jgi:hypothetical protein
MFKIDIESIKKIVEINNMLNQLEVKGASNVGILYNSMLILRQVIEEIDKQNPPDKPIVVDNTKGG